MDDARFARPRFGRMQHRFLGSSLLVRAPQSLVFPYLRRCCRFRLLNYRCRLHLCCWHSNLNWREFDHLASLAKDLDSAEIATPALARSAADSSDECRDLATVLLESVR